MAIKVPTPVTQGAGPLGDIQAPPMQSPYLSNSYPTPPVMDVSSGANWMGAQIQQLGRGLSALAVDYQQSYDQARLLEAETDYLRLEKDINDTLRGVEGLNAVGAGDAVQARLDQFRAEHNYDGLSPAAKRAMDKMLTQYDTRAVGAARDYEYTQVETARDNELSAGLQLQVDRAALSPATTRGNAEFDAAVSVIQQKVENYGVSKGWSAAQIEEKQRQYTSAAVMNRVAQIADGTMNGGNWQPLEAMGELQDALKQGQINTDDYNKMYAVLDKAVIQAQGGEAGAVAVQKSFEAMHGIAGSAMTSALSPYGPASEGTRLNPGTIPTGLTPGFQQGLQAVNSELQALGLGSLSITSGYRSSHQQAEIVATASWAPNGDRLAFYGLDSAQYRADWARLREEARGAGPETEGSKELAAIRLGQLWNDRLRAAGVNAAGGNSVAVPGYSDHNWGRAADVNLNGRSLASLPAETQRKVREVTARYGFAFPVSGEAWHMVHTASPRAGGSVGELAPVASVGQGPVANGGQTGVTVDSLAMIGLVGGGADLGVGDVTFWQGGQGNDHLTTDQRGNPTSYHKDWSQFVGVYYAGPQRGAHDIPVGTRNGQTVWRAPDYARGPDGKYLMVSGDEALEIIRNNGWLVPTKAEWQAAAKAAQHYKPGDAGYPHADEPDQEAARARYLDDVDAWRAGMPEGTVAMYGKEFVTTSLPGTEVGAPGSGAMPDMPWLQSYGGGKPPQNLVNSAIAIANEAGIPPQIFLALIQAESSWRDGLTSSAGAYGLAQLMPGTAAYLGVDPKDPIANMRGGAKYLAQQYAKYGDWSLALAAYNAGPDAVDKYGGQIPPYNETENYVRKIIAWAGDPKAPFPFDPGQLGATAPGTPPGLDPGAAYVWNMPQSTPRERAIRASAMDYYTANQRFVLQQQDINSAALLDEGYTRVLSAGVGSNFYQLFSPDEIRQLGTQVDSLINFHQKISSGATVQTDPEVMFAWRELAYDDPEMFANLYRKADTREFLMGALAPEDRDVLDNIYTTIRGEEAAAQTAAQAAAQAPRMPGDTYSPSEARSFVENTAAAAALTGQKREQYITSVAEFMIREATAKAVETGQDVKGTAAMMEAYDRATQRVGFDGGETTVHSLLQSDPARPDLTKVDVMFAKEADPAEALIDALVEPSSGLMGGVSGVAPWNREDLELIRVGFENERQRAPTAGELLQDILYWSFLQLGDTPFAPFSWAGQPGSRAQLPPPRKDDYVPYRIPGTGNQQPTDIPPAQGTQPGADPLATFGLGATPAPEPFMMEQPRPPGMGQGPMPAVGQ